MTEASFYKKVCEKRFDEHKETIKSIDGKVDQLMITVNNGLTSKVNRIDKLLWILIGAIIVESVVGRFF